MKWKTGKMMCILVCVCVIRNALKLWDYLCAIDDAILIVSKNWNLFRLINLTRAANYSKAANRVEFDFLGSIGSEGNEL